MDSDLPAQSSHAALRRLLLPAPHHEVPPGTIIALAQLPPSSPAEVETAELNAERSRIQVIGPLKAREARKQEGA